MLITKISQLTGITHEREVPVTEEQLQAWKQGELIQRAMPNISPGDREFLMSGITPEEWEEHFGGSDE